MHFTNFITSALVAFITTTLAQSNAIVSLALSTDSSCSSTPTTFEMETNRCYSFGDAKGMRVTHHSPGAKYNACKHTLATTNSLVSVKLTNVKVRVFTTANCDAGQDWKYVELDGGVCEDVSMYKAYLVKLTD